MPWEISAYGGKLMKISLVVLALEHLFKPDLPMTRVALWNPHRWFVSPWGPPEHVMNFGAQPSFNNTFSEACNTIRNTYLNGSYHIDILQPNTQIIVIVPIFQAVQIIPEASMDASSLIHFIRSETWAWEHILNLYLKNQNLQAAWIPPFSPAITRSRAFDFLSAQRHSSGSSAASCLTGEGKIQAVGFFFSVVGQIETRLHPWAWLDCGARCFYSTKARERNGCLVSIGLQGQCAGRYTPEIGRGSLQAHVAYACLCQLWSCSFSIIFNRYCDLSIS